MRETWSGVGRVKEEGSRKREGQGRGRGRGEVMRFESPGPHGLDRGAASAGKGADSGLKVCGPGQAKDFMGRVGITLLMIYYCSPLRCRCVSVRRPPRLPCAYLWGAGAWRGCWGALPSPHV